MTKPKRPIEVGNRIYWVNGLLTSIDTVCTYDPKQNCVYTGSGKYVHRRQITKVIRKKKKREPRVLEFREHRCALTGAVSLVEANGFKDPIGTKYIKFVEILE